MNMKRRKAIANFLRNRVSFVIKLSQLIHDAGTIFNTNKNAIFLKEADYLYSIWNCPDFDSKKVLFFGEFMPIFAGKVTNRVYSARELASRVVDQTLFQGIIRRWISLSPDMKTCNVKVLYDPQNQWLFKPENQTDPQREFLYTFRMFAVVEESSVSLVDPRTARTASYYEIHDHPFNSHSPRYKRSPRSIQMAQSTSSESNVTSSISTSRSAYNFTSRDDVTQSVSNTSSNKNILVKSTTFSPTAKILQSSPLNGPMEDMLQGKRYRVISELSTDVFEVIPCMCSTSSSSEDSTEVYATSTQRISPDNNLSTLNFPVELKSLHKISNEPYCFNQHYQKVNEEQENVGQTKDITPAKYGDSDPSLFDMLAAAIRLSDSDHNNHNTNDLTGNRRGIDDTGHNRIDVLNKSKLSIPNLDFNWTEDSDVHLAFSSNHALNTNSTYSDNNIVLSSPEEPLQMHHYVSLQPNPHLPTQLNHHLAGSHRGSSTAIPPLVDNILGCSYHQDCFATDTLDSENHKFQFYGQSFDTMDDFENEADQMLLYKTICALDLADVRLGTQDLDHDKGQPELTSTTPDYAISNLKTRSVSIHSPTHTVDNKKCISIIPEVRALSTIITGSNDHLSTFDLLTVSNASYSPLHADSHRVTTTPNDNINRMSEFMSRPLKPLTETFHFSTPSPSTPNPFTFSPSTTPSLLQPVITPENTFLHSPKPSEHHIPCAPDSFGLTEIHFVSSSAYPDDFEQSMSELFFNIDELGLLTNLSTDTVSSLSSSTETVEALVASTPINLPKKFQLNDAKRHKRTERTIRKAYSRRWESIVTGECVFSVAEMALTKKRIRLGQATVTAAINKVQEQRKHPKSYVTSLPLSEEVTSSPSSSASTESELTRETL